MCLCYIDDTKQDYTRNVYVVLDMLGELGGVQGVISVALGTRDREIAWSDLIPNKVQLQRAENSRAETSRCPVNGKLGQHGQHGSAWAAMGQHMPTLANIGQHGGSMAHHGPTWANINKSKV